ncbi:MAG: hypothetical protein IJS96_09150 [Schwartzia sp.]|nr:hypothetical protein [Schwartzia sp. (in: firmicutes)]
MAIHQMTIHEGDSPGMDILAEIAAAPETVSDDMPEITDEEIAAVKAAMEPIRFGGITGQISGQGQEIKQTHSLNKRVAM